MAKWTVGDGEDQFVIETTDQTMFLSIPSKKRIEVTPDRMRDIRAKMGFAIGVAQDEAS